MDLWPDPEKIGGEIYNLATEIYPICRSITGDGVRATLRHLAQHIKLDVHEVATGTPAFDWTVPREWNIRDAYIKDSAGNKIVDFAHSNLHVVSYSVPVRAHLSLAELKKHLYSLPLQPDLIPYRTSYYAENWGFCVRHSLLERLKDDTYEVVIDSTLKDGFLTYGEFLHRGETDDEVLLSAHICHPSLANDNCSGLALLTYLAKAITQKKTRYSYRFLFAPGSIGALTWLSQNEDKAARIKHGIIVSGVGDGGGPTYKKSRRGNAEIDMAMARVLRSFGQQASIIDFSPYGYDERQYCSPGFNLPVGLFQRSKWGTFPEYHTSADNLDFIKPKYLGESYGIISEALAVIESSLKYENTSPKGEPHLGKRGLYGAIGGDKDGASRIMTMLWVLNLSDREHSLLDIAERAGLPYSEVSSAAVLLEKHGLLRRVQPTGAAAGRAGDGQ